MQQSHLQDPTDGKAGPIAWQVDNAGLFDEHKNVALELGPTEDRLISTK